MSGPFEARPDGHPDFVEGAESAVAMSAMEEKRMDEEVEEKEAVVEEEEDAPEEEERASSEANVGNGNPPAEVEADYWSLTKPELKELLADRGVNVSARASKEELVALAEEEE